MSTPEKFRFGIPEMRTFAEESDDLRIKAMWSKIAEYRRKMALWTAKLARKPEVRELQWQIIDENNMFALTIIGRFNVTCRGKSWEGSHAYSCRLHASIGEAKAYCQNLYQNKIWDCLK